MLIFLKFLRNLNILIYAKKTFKKYKITNKTNLKKKVPKSKVIFSTCYITKSRKGYKKRCYNFILF